MSFIRDLIKYIDSNVLLIKHEINHDIMNYNKQLLIVNEMKKKLLDFDKTLDETTKQIEKMKGFIDD